ncbi:MAG: C25 family cysteine peptidase [bacterium]
MKKVIFLTIFISLIDLPAFGEGVLTKFDSVNSSMSCRVDIAPLKIKSIDGYEAVKSPDCYQSTEVGKPGLPVRSFFVLLPPNTTIKDIAITSIEQIELEGEYNIKPVLPPIPISKGSKNTPPISQSEDFYPEKILKINSIQKLRGYTIACISVFGACYNPKTKTLIWNKQINFKLNLTPSKIKDISPKVRGIREDEELVNKLVVNPELTSAYGLRLKPLETSSTYTYVIITGETLLTAFQPLLNFKINQKGLTGTIATTQWIYANNNYQGDEMEKIKAFITDHYMNYGTRYVLLGGDVDIIPYRGVYAWVSGAAALKTEEYEDKNIPCDLYYACFDNEWDWDTDGDEIYGELNEDYIDLMPEVYIGRAPVSNSAEATNFVNKIITCENSQDDYLYKELLVAYKLDENNDGKKIMEEIAASYTPTPPYTIYREYQSDGKGDKSAVISLLNLGVGLVAHAGHANHQILQSNPCINISDIRALVNGDKTFIFNTIGCIAGDFSQTDCIGEEMILNSNGGAVAFVGNSRYGWYEETDVKLYSGEYQIEFFKKFFKEGYTHIGETLGRSKMEFIGKCYTHSPYRWIMFCLNLLGDPAMEFHAPKEIFWIDHTIKEVIDTPGTITDLIITLKNLTDGTITGVVGTLTTTDEYISIVKGTATFGNIPSNATATNSSNPYKIMVNSNCPSVHNAYFSLKIGGQGGYENSDKFWVKINLKVDGLIKVIHFPNPSYPDEGDVLKIANIPLNSNPKVYIYNLAGELIRTLDEEGTEIKKYPASEEAIWNAKNEEGKEVSFGVYIYILKCDVGMKKGKIAIIR